MHSARHAPNHCVDVEDVQVGEALLAVPAPEDVQAVADEVAAVRRTRARHRLCIFRALGFGLIPGLSQTSHSAKHMTEARGPIKGEAAMNTQHAR